MAEIFSEWMDKLKSKISISEIVSSYATLQTKGSRKWACCPFHHEKTPSFTVNEDNQTFYCFGCHIGGDAITFVEEIENVEFMEAVKILADRYHMPIPDFSNSDSASNLKKHKDKLYDMMRETAGYFHNNLMGDGGKIAREYLLKRGISAATARTFGLGYSLGNKQLIAHLMSKGYTIEQMQEAGLVEKSEKGNYYDVMFGRLIVPIINNVKQVIAFGGRVLDDSKPKYRNTKETILFNKSKEIFGQHSVKKAKLEGPVKDLIMVEGYMDVISLYQYGVKNAIASMGTALTTEQSKLIKRYVDKVIICYDGDSAGQNATMRGLDILYEQGLDVRVVSLPDNLDPDEYVRKYGRDSYLQQLVNAKPLFEHKLNVIASKYDLTSPQEKGKYAVEAMNTIKVISDPAIVEAYIEFVAKKTGLSKETLKRQFDQSETATINIKNAQPKISTSAFDRAIRYVLYGLFGGIENVECNEDLSLYIVDKNQKALYDLYRAKKESAQNTIEELLKEEETNVEVRPILDEGSKIGDDIAKQYFEDCVAKIVKDGTKRRKRALTKAIDNETDDEARFIMISQLAQSNK